jgi:hypothetical protein
MNSISMTPSLWIQNNYRKVESSVFSRNFPGTILHATPLFVSLSYSQSQDRDDAFPCHCDQHTSAEKECSDLDTFLRQRIGINVKNLDPRRSTGYVTGGWAAWKQGKLISPRRNARIRGYIGVSKYCCRPCDFVLKHITTLLQKL